MLTAIANFFGHGTVNVNRADETSVRYQIRIVDPEVLTNVIIPFFEIVKLKTKKKNEFVIWADATRYMLKNKPLTNNTSAAINLVNKIKNIKYEGAGTNQALKFLKTCDTVINRINEYAAKQQKKSL